MASSPKSDRTQPNRVFENYVLSYVSTPLTNVTENIYDKFTQLSGSAGTPASTGSFSEAIPIGFDFSFNQTVYKSFVVATSGWIALVDPTTPFQITHLFDSGSFFSVNGKLKTSGFGANHVVLAPWFDKHINQRFLPEDAFAGVAMRDGYFKGVRSWIEAAQGSSTPSQYYNSTDRSIQYLTQDSDRGRRLVVRWNSNLRNVFNLQYECVVYEDGTIEFRYNSRRSFFKLNDQQAIFGTDGAAGTCGIFACSTANRFRDFSINLQYNSTPFAPREQYKFGGATFSSNWLDANAHDAVENAAIPNITASYGISLNPAYNWPGNDEFGAMFVFSPPKNKAKILVRSLLHERDNRQRRDQIRRFDDRNTLVYASGVVSYPSRLERFFGAPDEARLNRQQLLFTNDIVVTASTVKNNADQFVDGVSNRRSTSLAPFTDLHFEQSQDSIFFATGTNNDKTAPDFTSALKSKTHFTINLPVDRDTQLLNATSTMHYYHSIYRSWTAPRRTIEYNNLAAVTTDWARPSMYLNFKVFPEDSRGFGPLGNSVASGSRVITTNIQSIPYIKQSVASQSIALSTRYEKNVQLAYSYSAGIEQFVFPLERPFLLEKAVIEIPFSAGDGWFKDRTSVCRPFDRTGSFNSSDGFLDMGGPAVTVSLFNQQGVARNTVLDLIMTGTVTHVFDNTSSVRAYKDPGMNWYAARNEGFLSFNSTPATIITPISSSTVGYVYTGTMVLEMQAAVGNGILALYEKDLEGLAISANGGNAGSQADYQSQVASSFTQRRVEYNSTVYNRVNLPNSGSTEIRNVVRTFQIDPFGRASTGFQQCGRSIFGKEFVTQQGITINNSVLNPLFVSDSTSELPTPIVDSLTTNTRSLAMIFSALSLRQSFASPYLLLPNDQLVLAFSKTRPALYSFGTSSIAANVFEFSGSRTGHDMMLNRGNIKITFYGSYVKENKEFHNIVEQPLDSDVVNDTIQNDVLDQFEVGYRNSFIGGTYDDFITGSLITKQTTNGIISFITGSRGRAYSRFSVDDVNVDNEAVFLQSTRITPLFESVGVLITNQCISSDERYYDSLSPTISDIVKTDGSQVYSGFFGTNDTSLTQRLVGYVYMNGKTTDFPKPDIDWCRSFPFESKYSTITRNINLGSTLVGRVNTSGAIYQNDDVRYDSIVFHMSGTIHPSNPKFWIIDLKIDSTGSTTNIGLKINDAAKMFFGIGDLNTLAITNGIPIGANNLPDLVQKATGFFTFGIAPVIRGWKYGLINAVPEYTKAYFRQGRFGMIRDMLEQRKDTKFINVANQSSPTVSDAAVTVRFISLIDGKTTNPELTWSSNLSSECTSSLPYFDGLSRNRGAINVSLLNNTNISI